MKLINLLMTLAAIVMPCFMACADASQDEMERLARQDMEWIENRQVRLQEVVGAKKRDCIQPLMQPMVFGAPPLELCGKDAEQYRRDNPNIMRFRNWLDDLFDNSFFNGIASLYKEYVAPIFDNGLMMASVHAPSGASGQEKLDSLQNDLLQYYKSNYKSWMAQSSTPEEYKALSARKMEEFIGSHTK